MDIKASDTNRPSVVHCEHFDLSCISGSSEVVANQIRIVSFPEWPLEPIDRYCKRRSRTFNPETIIGVL